MLASRITHLKLSNDTTCAPQNSQLILHKKQHKFNKRCSIRTHIAAPESSSTTIASTAANSTTDDAFTQKDWNNFIKGWDSQFVEHAMWLDESMIEGTIPPELQGTLLRNGPGLFEIGGKRINQPFDGDGMACQFSFPGNGQPPFFSNRFIRTKAFVEEQLANKMIYKGAFQVGNPSGGWLFNPFDLSVKKVANTGIVYWAGRILATYEQDRPYELAPPDLRTVGTDSTDLEGRIDGPFFAGHYRIIENESGSSKKLIGFCTDISGNALKAIVWEFDEEFNTVGRTEVEMPDAPFAFQHDMIVTENYYVFLENPVVMNFKKFVTEYMFGKACIAECLQYDPNNKQTKIHLVARPHYRDYLPPFKRHRIIPTQQPFFSFHHINAYETVVVDNVDNNNNHTDNHVVIDTVALPNGIDFSSSMDSGSSYYTDPAQVGRGVLTRLIVDLDNEKVVDQRSLLDRAVEFPRVARDGKAHRHVYLAGSRFDDKDRWSAPQVTIKVTLPSSSDDNTSTNSVEKEMVYNPGKNRFAQEPIFVPKHTHTDNKKEDEGWVLVLVYDADTEKTDLVLLNAEDMSVQATIHLPFALPAGLHGSFTSEAVLGGSSGREEWKNIEYDIRNGPLRYE